MLSHITHRPTGPTHDGDAMAQDARSVCVCVCVYTEKSLGFGRLEIFASPLSKELVSQRF